MRKVFPFLLIALLAVGTIAIPHSVDAAFGFLQRGVSHDTPGLASGVWHGLVAPYALVLGLFTNIGVYAYPNAGWVYDAGFLLGVACSLPIGWILAIISLVLMIV